MLDMNQKGKKDDNRRCLADCIISIRCSCIVRGTVSLSAMEGWFCDISL